MNEYCHSSWNDRNFVAWFILFHKLHGIWRHDKLPRTHISRWMKISRFLNNQAFLTVTILWSISGPIRTAIHNLNHLSLCFTVIKARFQVGAKYNLIMAKQTLNKMLYYCWLIICDHRPAWIQHQLNVTVKILGVTAEVFPLVFVLGILLFKQLRRGLELS